MARVTEDEVRAIMVEGDVTDTQITPMILAAEEVITNVFASDTTISETLLKEIQRWFVAHMVAATVQRTVTEERIGDVSVKYTGYFSKKLEATPYGQMVLTLDISGKMAKTGKAVASMYAIKSDDNRWK